MAVSSRSGTGANQEAVRRHNLAEVLRAIHVEGRTTRAWLTREMALNRSTIGAITSTLQDLGLVRACEVRAPGRAGRPSAGVEIVREGPCVIAIDIRVDRLRVAAVALGGHVAALREIDLEPAPAPDAVADRVVELTRQVRAEISGPIMGAGISVPGVVRAREGMVDMAPNLGWTDVALVELVSDRWDLRVPVTLGNDADLGALAEHLRGAGREVDHMVYLSGDVGVGAGVIAHGRPLGGASGYAGEFGHMGYNPSGTPCHCGAIGCWETEVGAMAIARAIGAPAHLVPHLGRVLSEYDADIDRLRTIGQHLGRGLGTIVNVLNPQRIVVGGYLAALYSLVADDVDDALATNAMRAAGREAQIVLPALGEHSVLLGAAEVALESLLTDPQGLVEGAGWPTATATL